MCLKTILFCVLVVLLVDFVCNTEALDERGEGVCVVKLSSRQRRKRPYNVAINKMCGRRKCVVKKYKFETYLTWTNHTVCCNGWQYDSESDACAPICSAGCSGGKCVSPDRCQCLSPAYLDPERPNTCITPTCDPTCINAICHINNTCVCKEKFTAYNSTHCYQCDQGYTVDDHLNCVPICEQTCVNATCTGPNICTCSNGFKPKNSSVCEPICNCVNSDCVAPNTCSCFKGYIRVNSSTCAPKCNSCSNGDCVAPNNCSCHCGYTKIKGICKPKCSKDCVNGFCSAPDVCSCKNGFVKSNSSAYVCVKSCDDSCKGYCEDGDCIKWNCSTTPIRGRGRRPGRENKKLVCCNHYEYDVELDKCFPICSLGCINGTCVDVDKCECPHPLTLVKNACIQLCDGGYEPDPKNKTNCVPICEPKCVHGFCVSPNTCKCNKGYENTGNSSVCTPKCDGCKNGRCVAPSNCSCFDGYERINSTCKPKCSACDNGDCIAPETCRCHDGYNMTKEGCKPWCSFPCNNGDCSAPNTCTCNDGYTSTEEGCKPVCSSPCNNGHCSAPNTCICNDGYTLTEEGCKPVCSSPCNNGHCSAPNTCTCNDGYTLTEEGCKPVCSSPCNNGHCSAPNTCTCNDGYNLTEEGCKPVCSSPCNNGHCSAPNTCTCNDGYTSTEEGCKPVCSMACINGYCSNPNICTCNKGYLKNDTDHSLCYKPCETKCLNGNCGVHGNCTCLPDFEFDNVTMLCVPIKLVECTECNGTCTEEDKKCQCADGRSCYLEAPEFPPEVAPSTKMAGLDLTLMSIGGACLLLLILVVVVMQRIWQKRHDYDSKPTSDGTALGSVVYTVPHTLIQSKRSEDFEDHDVSSDDEATTNTLLRREAQLP